MADEQFPAAQTALEEYRRIEQEMSQPEVASDPDKMRKLGPSPRRTRLDRVRIHRLSAGT